MLILLVLFIFSFYYPLLWVGFILYLIWFIKTASIRRDHEIMKVIGYMISSEKDKMIVNHIFWESFCSFAIEHGARMPEFARNKYDTDIYTFEININAGLLSGRYRITFQHWETMEGKPTCVYIEFINSLVEELYKQEAKSRLYALRAKRK